MSANVGVGAKVCACVRVARLGPSLVYGVDLAQIAIALADAWDGKPAEGVVPSHVVHPLMEEARGEGKRPRARSEHNIGCASPGLDAAHPRRPHDANEERRREDTQVHLRHRIAVIARIQKQRHHKKEVCEVRPIAPRWEGHRAA